MTDRKRVIIIYMVVIIREIIKLHNERYVQGILHALSALTSKSYHVVMITVPVW